MPAIEAVVDALDRPEGVVYADAPRENGQRTLHLPGSGTWERNGRVFRLVPGDELDPERSEADA
jgi:hypothetical protein